MLKELLSMNPVTVKTLDARLFNALAAHTRNPAAALVSQEIAWFANQDETVIAAMLHNTVTDNFGGVILGRDATGNYQCVEFKTPMQSEREAKSWIETAIMRNSIKHSSLLPNDPHELMECIG